MKSILSAVVGATLALSAIEANGQATPGERQVALTIETDTLASALDKWAQQSGFQIFVQDWEGAKNLPARSLKGTFTAQDALEQLLAGTPLTYVWISDKAVSIRKKVARTVPTALQRTSLEGQQGIPVAKFSGDDAGNAEARSAQSPAASDTSARELTEIEEEIVVAGSRLKKSPESATPVVTFDRRRIDQIGVSSVSDVLNYVPQQSYSYSGDNFRSGGARFAELRGIGLDTTLVLINGRRTIPSGPSIGFNAFDLNTIPLAAVESIDVLSDSASAIYGADAVGGVININLKKHIPRPVVDLHYGSASGGTDERRASLSAGYSGERLHALVIADYFDRERLVGAERDITSTQDFRRFGGADRRLPVANPGTVLSLTGTNLPGLPSPFAAVPSGSTGVNLTPAAFLPTAGVRTFDSANRYSGIPEAERRSGSGFLEFAVTPATSLFAELLYVDRETISPGFPDFLAPGVVPATNPFNPFGVPVAVTYLFTGIGPREQVTENQLLRSTLGLRGALGSWDWEISALDTRDDGKSWFDNTVDPVRAAAALAATDPAQALNVFQDGPGGSEALLRSLVAAPVVSKYSSDSTQGTGFVRGPLFSLPAGLIEAVIGAEWRKEDIVYNSGGVVIDQDRDVSAAFSELRVPLISPDMGIPGLRTMSLSVAARYDDYSDFGDTTNPQYALTLSPVAGLLLRASYSTSFRAPSLFELYSPLSAFPGQSAIDPRRNNEVVSITQRLGGNTELQPIEADSFTAGFVVTPTNVPALQLSANYWRVKMDRRVSVFQLQEMLNFEALFPNEIVRAAPTPDDVAAGLPGRLQSVSTVYVNFGLLETSGIDLGAAWSIDTPIGEFAPTAAATWIEKYETASLPNVPPLQRLGNANVNGSIPRWRAAAGIAWNRGALSLSTTARYVHSYMDANRATGIPIGRVLPSQTFLDFQGALSFDDLFQTKSLMWSGTKLTVGVTNLLNEGPDFAEVGGTLGYDASQGDLRERFGYVRLSKSF